MVWDNYGHGSRSRASTAACRPIRGIGGNKPFMLTGKLRTSRTGSDSADRRPSGKTQLAGRGTRYDTVQFFR